jgi:hypothetical protein
MDNFYTSVIQADPRFNSVARIADPTLLEPVTRAAVQNIIAGAGQQGINLMVFETFRSQQRQLALFAQKATQLQQVGVHHYGLACDLVCLVGGEPSWKPDYSFLGALAAQYGLVWGGSWATFKDMDHVQNCTVAQQPSLFAGTWYPS